MSARHHVRKDGFGVQRDRIRIAQAAARLIAEHGLADWTLAKRKAVRQLLLPDTTALPSNDEIEVALADHHALFGADAHARTLRQQRIDALAWMRRLEPWDPVLVGGVAAGWATEHSEVRLELVADDPKAVEIALAGSDISYTAAAAREDDAATHLRITTPRVAIRLVIVNPLQRRNRPRKGDEPRLTAAALAALLASEPRGDASP
jgi:phage tail protein X